MYKPSAPADVARTHSFSETLLHGVFMGYVQHAGGGWTGDLNVLDAEEVAAAQHFSDINIRRFKSQEVTPKLCGKEFVFPLADGSLRQPGVNPQDAERSDPFRSAGGPSPDSNDDEGDTEWKELEPFDAEEETQQKADPDSERPERARREASF